MKKTIFALFLVIAVILIMLTMMGPVFAGTSSGVSVTVTAKNISISVSPGTYNYGALALGTTTETASTFTATNEGNVTENFLISGTDTADWTLAGTAGADQYEHDWKQGSGSYTALATGNQAAGGPVAAGNSLSSYKFQIHMPTSSTSFAQQATTVTFMATE